MFKRSVCSRFAANMALSGILIALVGAGLATPAEARHHHRHAHHAHVARHHGHSGVHARVAARQNRNGAVAPVGATAAIVVDGASGRMIYGLNENAPRHPASVTKVMTLYLLFEQLEKGRFSLNDEIEISAHAAAQSPSKLGLRPGQTIRVEDAIKAICTKSANDIAVAVAEAVGGTESDFAEQMTRKAYSLGMNHTFYRNASGLPNPEQITTAADLAVLGRSIQERFPRYYRYFSMHEFAYRGQRIHNHNHLMDRVEGMDGIKTGYTAASGFNLLSSVKRDGHYIVSVVMGGKSARSRDNYMEALIEKYIDEGGSARGATRVAEQEEPARQAKVEPRSEPERKPVVLAPPSESAASDAPVRLPVAAVSPDPRPRPAYVSAAQPSRENEETRLPTATIARHASAADGSTSAQAHESAGAVTPAGRWIAGPAGREALRAAVRFQPSGKAETRSEAKSEAKLDNRIEIKPPVRPELKQEAKLETKAVSKTDESASTSKQALPTKPPVPGWMIQIGATDDADKAAALLSKAKAQRGSLLASAKPYTEKVSKGGGTIYRARFAGLEESRAEAVCKALKTSGFSCFTTRN
ncbi:SPOR domain-containing protein [Rhodoblastus sp. 17X3]|uniref:serine hydrolase n=1 Tax=Rhodoblastus sp. 17X3 TaxID=3047026 RepID=UPI0024B715E2|nr:serine hydrolase [Rhodoblastus sp. 17X3]MDI9847522.1 SPOR domain-containing protein [Rhodoblastus sp. 17X3]